MCMDSGGGQDVTFKVPFLCRTFRWPLGVSWVDLSSSHGTNTENHCIEQCFPTPCHTIKIIFVWQLGVKRGSSSQTDVTNTGFQLPQACLPQGLLTSTSVTPLPVCHTNLQTCCLFVSSSFLKRDTVLHNNISFYHSIPRRQEEEGVISCMHGGKKRLFPLRPGAS